jgi:RNA polymerase sigma-70 factor (ECF subfamily)
MIIILPDIPMEDRLLARARTGDEAAVMQIYESYFEPIYQYLRLRVDDRMLAEDLASDVFVKLITALNGRNAPQHSLRGWLFQVARNVLYDHYGTTRKMPVTTIEDWVRAPQEDEPEIQFIHNVDAGRARHAMQMLAADQQEVLVLRFGQALSLQETADIMGKSVSAIKSLQFRAVETLRQILGKVQAGANDVA